MTADEIIARLDLKPHPEGGHYRETWSAQGEGRPSGTCIYFLLKSTEVSHWHRVDATEIWHYYAGAPLVLSTSKGATLPHREKILGPNLEMGQFPQLIVEANLWQSARTKGDWTLVGCTVSPGFQFSGFELAGSDFKTAQ